MNRLLRTTLAVAATAFAAQAAAQVTFYENEGFQGRSFTSQQRINNFARFGFNDRASSAIVARNRWEICEDVRFDGRCVVLRPGRYPSLASMGLNNRISSMRAVAANARIETAATHPLRSPRRSPSTKTRAFGAGISPRRSRSPTSGASASMTAPRRSTSSATAGRFARTPGSGDGAWYCVRAGIRRSPQWA